MKIYLANCAKTPNGKAARELSDAKYRKSAKRKATAARHRNTLKGKATRQKYRQSFKGKAANSRYKKNHRGKVNANTWKRRAAQLSRTPKWANLEAIKQIYINCPRGMEVDHVIPLRGKLVSGLHVENNLQYLTPTRNHSKGNKFNPRKEKKSE